MDTHKDSKILGTSATPIRYLDPGRHRGEELFDGNCVDKMTISEAIAQKILPAPLYVASYYSLLGELDEMESRLDRRGNENLKYRLANKIRKAKSMLSKKDFELKNIFKKHISETNSKLSQFEDEYMDKKVGSWLCDQRKKFRNKKLSENHQSLLEDLGVVFGEKTEFIFNNNLSLLKNYISKHGEFPNSTVVYEDFKLGLWCIRQRNQFSKGKLKDFQINSLKEVGFDFNKTRRIRT